MKFLKLVTNGQKIPRIHSGTLNITYKNAEKMRVFQNNTFDLQIPSL